MVSTACFPPSAAARRYPAPRTPYLASYVERSRATEQREPSCTAIMTEGTDDTTSQRKRIAVACGRCRKRKIRCSGDSGNGDPCINCRNAGSEPCRFLRVLSEELSPKGDMFSYNLDASRIVQARGSSVAPTLSLSTYTDNGLGLAETTGLSAYRGGGSVSAYGGSGSGNDKHASMGWSSGYPDDPGVEYTMCPPSFQAVADSSYLTTPYRLTSSTPSSKQAVLFVDGESPFGYGAAAGMRQRSGAEAAGLTFQSLASPGQSRSTQRMAGPTRGLPGPGPPPSPYSTDYRRSQQQAAPAGSGYHGFESASLSYGGQGLAGQIGRAGDVFAAASEGLLQGAEGSLRTTAASTGPETGYSALSDPVFHHNGHHQHHHNHSHPPHYHSTSTAESGSAVDGSQPAYLFHGHQQQHQPGGSGHEACVMGADAGADRGGVAGDGRRPSSSAKMRA